MKAERLEMQAFGSYLEPTVLDFTLLGETPIFLITGSTGGGKTTLLDAMCFALYCRSTGGRRSWTGMRCTHAPRDTETRVEFTFRLGTERYRFLRALSVYIARGSDSILKSRETHECWQEKDGAWELLCAGAERTVRERAEQLLGLTCEQFSQVMVLPQGDFLRLLLSNSREKAQMFQTLFATGRWERAVFVLKERAGKLERHAGELRAARQAILDREGAETPEVLATLLSGQKASLAALREALKKARTDAEKKNTILREAKALADQFTARAANTERLLALEKRLPEREDALARLKRARQAQGVLPYSRAAKEASREQEEKTLALQNAERLAKEAEESALHAEEALARARECRIRVEALAKESGALAGAVENARRAAALRTQREQSAKALAAGLEKEAGAREQMEVAAKRVTDGGSYIAKAQEDAERLTSLMDEVQVLLRTNAAAELANTLTEGSPCPVCGSVYHPSPAHPSERLKDAEAALEAAKKSAQTLTAAQKRVEQRRAELEKAQKALSALREDCARLRSTEEAAARSLAELEQGGAPASLPELEQRAAALSREKQEAATLADKLEAGVSAKRSANAAAKASLTAAKEAYRTASEAKERTKAQLADALAAAHLDPETDYAAWGIAPEAMAELEERWRQFDAALQGAQERKNEFDTLLAGKEPPTLTDQEAAYTEAQNCANSLAKEAGAVEQRTGELENSIARLNAFDAQGGETEAEFTRTKRLADLLSGKNALHVPLQQFVLGIMLDDILTAANQFFAMLSSGRYCLGRVTGASGGHAYAGLDIEVTDAFSGGARAVETLSGGELFLASLSLAFGLSEVVQSYSGGVRLDSLFIDEGFGSLDQETLDTAMRALLKLQGMGRTIGMISHVSELKARIAAQVVVTKRTDGTSTLKAEP